MGAGLFYGDAVLTPAISVLSAVEGLKLATPMLGPYVVPITLAILIGPLRRAEPGHRPGRGLLRPRHAVLVRDPGRDRPAPHRRRPERRDGASIPHYAVMFFVNHSGVVAARFSARSVFR